MRHRFWLGSALALCAVAYLGLAIRSGAETWCLLEQRFSAACAGLLPSYAALDWPALAIAAQILSMVVLGLGGLGYVAILLAFLRAERVGGEPGSR
ncbi:MAG: hypothetical protein K2X11_15720 [Acetobacteraceae bacterium]|nr:hypothetical protein [Acetobacteraceae bacterium]